MRVRIIFSLGNRGASVPFHHQYLLSNLIEDLKADLSEEFRHQNLYCFSGLKGQTKVGKSGLHFFSNKVTLVFTSPDKDFIDAILKRLFKEEMVEVGNLCLTPESVEREYAPEFTEDVKYVCISPLVLAGPNTDISIEKDFIPPFDDAFSDYLYESTMVRMQATGRYTQEQIESFFKFQVVPDKQYLAKIKEASKKFSRIYSTELDDERREVRGYTFPFTLYAAKEVQEFLFDCGFGEYAMGGFGMIDIANTNPIGRAEPYPII
ncbi:MAG: CRISPR-associated endoribonuclease Cas6 [Cytophagales bacterium]|nr:CRISPR-associated endoribonuclease Cas6 [Cytophagales bacterium]